MLILRQFTKKKKHCVSYRLETLLQQSIMFTNIYCILFQFSRGERYESWKTVTTFNFLQALLWFRIYGVQSFEKRSERANIDEILSFNTKSLTLPGNNIKKTWWTSAIKSSHDATTSFPWCKSID